MTILNLDTYKIYNDKNGTGKFFKTEDDFINHISDIAGSDYAETFDMIDYEEIKDLDDIYNQLIKMQNDPAASEYTETIGRCIKIVDKMFKYL